MMGWLLIFVLGYFLISVLVPRTRSTRITYDRFRDSLENNSIEYVVLTNTMINGAFKEPGGNGTAAMDDTATDLRRYLPFQQEQEGEDLQFQVVRVEDEKLLELLEEQGVSYRAKKDSGLLGNILIWVIPLLFLILFWRMMFRGMSRTMGGGGGGPGNILNIGQSKAKQYIKGEKNDVSFKDVAGVDEAKEELSEMIQFLKNPKQFTRLGGKLPKGVILVGPPGTGKTLLARAVAGEASVPFFSLTGSEFVEMFVGVGAARVRDLFKEAKSKAPCIVFIDEIDAIGKSRGQAIQMSANDERENTLNQLLSEMDGFEPGDGMLIMASTNRPEVLDKALLRPGRFDRQVMVSRPDVNGRTEILKVHTRDLKLHPDLELRRVASQTPGFSGADLANIANEAALMAARKNKDAVDETDFQEAIERVIAGLEKKNRLINPKEKKIVAFHESGHALVGHFTEGADPIHKVSIVPRGFGALGYTLQTPLEDRFLMTKSELEGKIKGLLGGRAAEEVIFGEISTGAANDLEVATRIATEMITVYGMSSELPHVSLKKSNQQDLLGRESVWTRHSERTESLVDTEVSRMISENYGKVVEMITENRDKLVAMAEELLEKETLQEHDVRRILDGEDQ